MRDGNAVIVHDAKYVFVDKVKNIPHTMTRTCQYTKSDLGQRDPKCVGCKHKEVK